MSKLSFVTYFTVLSAPLLAQKTDTTFYSVVINGTTCGEQSIWKSDSNEYNYIFHYNDRGRGSNMRGAIRTNPSGLIKSISISGLDDYKNPYTESFDVRKDSAIATLNDKNISKLFNNEFYDVTIVPGMNELRIKWLLSQPGMRSATFFNKIIKAEKPKVLSIIVRSDQKDLKLFSIYTDINPAPEYVWMTKDLSFFARVDTWMSIVPKGYEHWADTLLSIQEKMSQVIFEKQVSELSSMLKKHIVIKHVTLFESTTATTKENMTVEVTNGKISAIYSSAKRKPVVADTIIDAQGKFLMPGLWDMHSHYFTEKGAWYLACGVTHVRDMGNAQIVETYQQQIEANKLLGPAISYLSGFIDKAGPMQGPNGKIVNSLSEALGAIEYFYKRKYNQIKIYNLIEPGWIKPMALKAHGYGMKFCGHIPAFANPVMAINDGFNEIIHLRGIFHSLIGGDTSTFLNRKDVGERVGRINLDDTAAYMPMVNLMKQKSISFDATVALFEQWYHEFVGDTSNALKPIESWLPDQFKKDNLIVSQALGTPDKKRAYKAAYQNGLKMLKLLYDNGIMLVAGTDNDPHYLHRELEIYVEAGIPPNQVLKIATYNAAKDCELQSQYGEIAIGKSADFILIAGNPMKNISDIRKVELVVKNGREYNPKKLYASRGWKYYY